jgi:hypothetical protein
MLGMFNIYFQGQILCMWIQIGSQKPAVIREKLPSHLLFTFQVQ